MGGGDGLGTGRPGTGVDGAETCEAQPDANSMSTDSRVVPSPRVHLRGVRPAPLHREELARLIGMVDTLSV